MHPTTTADARFDAQQSVKATQQQSNAVGQTTSYIRKVIPYVKAVGTVGSYVGAGVGLASVFGYGASDVLKGAGRLTRWAGREVATQAWEQPRAFATGAIASELTGMRPIDLGTKGLQAGAAMLTIGNQLGVPQALASGASLAADWVLPASVLADSAWVAGGMTAGMGLAAWKIAGQLPPVVVDYNQYTGVTSTYHPASNLVQQLEGMD
jgi:hypothetical protein